MDYSRIYDGMHLIVITVTDRGVPNFEYILKTFEISFLYGESDEE